MWKRIWPLDDEARMATDKVVITEDKERAGPLARARAGASAARLRAAAARLALAGHVVLAYGRRLRAIGAVEARQTAVSIVEGRPSVLARLAA